MTQLQSQESALFVYLAWETRGGRPLLGSDPLRQAVYQAITQRSRSLRCHILAIDGTAKAIHLIARFPGSLQISAIARISQAAAGEVITRWEEALQDFVTPAKSLWEPTYTGRTLWLEDERDASTYLRRQMAAAEESVKEEPVQEHDWNLAELEAAEY